MEISIYYQFCLIFILTTTAINAQNRVTFDVTNYGADVKGIDKSTAAIYKAIDESANVGGAEIYFPSGVYLSGPIHLKSNTTLYLAENATIKFSNDFDDYLPMVRMRWEGTELINFSPLIYADGVSNVAIIGEGVLDGQGKHWWDEYKLLREAYNVNKTLDSKWQKEFFRVNDITEVRKLLDDPSRVNLGFLRPPFFQLINSTNITVHGVTIRNSPFWNMNPVYSKNIVFSSIRIEAPNPSPNTDGIDPDSCSNVIIHNVTFNVGDDCIAIKSGRDAQGRQIGIPSENIAIHDCTFLRGVSVVAIGSEESGGVRNVSVSNCVAHGTDRGIFIKAKRGRGGVVENIKVTNLTLINIRYEAIFVQLAYAPSSQDQTTNTSVEPFSERTPVYRNIEISNVVGNAQTAVRLIGLPESPIENITLADINIVAPIGLVANNTKNLNLERFSHISNATKF